MTLHERLLSRLREELAIAEKATPGPWLVSVGRAGQVGVYTTGASNPGALTAYCETTPQTSVAQRDSNAFLIARSRTLLPALLRGLIVEVQTHVIAENDRGDAAPGMRCDGCDEWGEMDMTACAAVRRWADVMGIKEGA